MPRDYRLADANLLALDLAVKKDGIAADVAISFIVGNPRTSEDVAMITATGAGTGRRDRRRRARRASRRSFPRDRGRPLRRWVSHQHRVRRPRHRLGHAPGPARAERRPPRTRIHVLRTGLLLALEPWVMADTDRLITDPDYGWTLRSATRARTAHSEHTIAITDSGAEILTLPDQDRAYS